jgi:MYXO-CTERM domain-containing protein
VLEEVIRSAMLNEYRPERTVVFYGYAAEEIGLVGSGEIAADAAERELQIAGVLQLDMTNYNPAPEPYLALVTDYTDEALTAYARTLIETYVKLPWEDTECGYACSDHGSWQRRDFPVHYVHEARTSDSNGEIHTERDTLELSDGSAQHSLYFAQYSAAFMAELAKGRAAECTATRACLVGEQCNAGSCEPIPSVGGGGMGGGAGTGGSGGNAGSEPLAGVGGSASVSGSAGMPAVVAGGAAPIAALPNPSTAVAPAAGESGCACRAATAPNAAAPLAGWGLLLLLGLARRRASLGSHALHGATCLRPSRLGNEP